MVKLNAAPVLAPIGTLSPEAAERLEIDLEHAHDLLAHLRASEGLADKLRAVYERAPPPADDVDVALYDGFVPDADRERMDAVHRRAPEELAGFDPGFTDARLPELYFRFRARNWPATLDESERARWRHLRARRLLRGEAGSPRSLAQFHEELAQVRADGRMDEALAVELEDWAGTLTADLDGAPGAGSG